jgi:hypothetical protein
LFPVSIRDRKEEDKQSKEGLGAPIVGVGEQEWRKENRKAGKCTAHRMHVKNLAIAILDH